MGLTRGGEGPGSYLGQAPLLEGKSRTKQCRALRKKPTVHRTDEKADVAGRESLEGGWAGKVKSRLNSASALR